MDIIVFGLGVERVPPLQGFSLSIDVNTMILRRKVCRICPMQGFWRTNLTVYLLDLLGNAVVSAVGTTLFHSPGCNEGEARNGTLGTHRQKQNELRRSGTNRANVWFVSLRSVVLHSLG